MLGPNCALIFIITNNNILTRVSLMKEKLILTAILVATVFPAWAVADTAQPLPEPSTLGLFVASAIAIAALVKLRK